MSINILLRNIGRFVALVFIQVFIFNNIHLTDYGIIPAVYIIYVILLPFETPNWMVMVLAFLIGFSIDVFSDTLGLNAAASVLIAFVRPGMLNLLAPRDGYDIGTFPRIYYMGQLWFLKYASALVIIHQITYYIFESFGLEDFFVSLLKIVIASFVTLILIYFSQYIFFRK
ncbi:MAG: rod shape-determining protein MreD [Bacteroidetes bacterium 4572_117]|nr:MAG: rod shape-determining protein MreD [Bacteroidetes bacterium 4572_117]